MTDAAQQLENDIEEQATKASRTKVEADHPATTYRLQQHEHDFEGFEIRWDVLPGYTQDKPRIKIGSETYHLPYYDLIPQSADPEALLRSIQQDGVREPVEVQTREDGHGYDVIDGNTRTYIAWVLGLDHLPTREIEPSTEAQDEEGHYHRDLDAVIRNTQRRQLTPEARRQLIPRIKDAFGWRKIKTASREGRQAKIARLLGVSEATISRDLATLNKDKPDQEKAQQKRRINSALTGLRYIDDMSDDLDLSESFTADEIKVGRSYVEALKRALEERRKDLDQEDE